MDVLHKLCNFISAGILLFIFDASIIAINIGLTAQNGNTGLAGYPFVEALAWMSAFYILFRLVPAYSLFKYRSLRDKFVASFDVMLALLISISGIFMCVFAYESPPDFKFSTFQWELGVVLACSIVDAAAVFYNSLVIFH